MTSTDDGSLLDRADPDAVAQTSAAWSGAALMPDGTPLFSQDGTGFVERLPRPERRDREERLPALLRLRRVARGRLDRARPGRRSTRTPTRTARSSTSRSAPISRPARPTTLKPTAPHDDRVPLVSDKSGNTFMAWPPGYPTATAFTVVPFRGGQPAGDGVTFRADFGGGDPHMALSVDPQDRLWAAWTGQGAVHVARSRTHGMDFGATVSVPLAGQHRVPDLRRRNPRKPGQDRRDRQHRLLARRAAGAPRALGEASPRRRRRSARRRS